MDLVKNLAIFAFCLIVTFYIGNAQNDYDFRIVNGNKPSNGIFEIYYNGTWGTVCHHFWTWDEYRNDFIRAACKSMGYTDGEAVNGTFFFGSTSGVIHFDGIIHCPSDATSVLDCQLYNLPSSYTTHCENTYVGGVCLNGTGTEEVLVSRLAGGSNAAEGRLELSIYGKSGTVCYDAWAKPPGILTVACRQFGFSNGVMVNPRPFFNTTDLGVIVDLMDCTGTEENLSQCTNYGYGAAPDYCLTHRDDIGMMCFNGTLDLPSRVIGMPNNQPNQTVLEGLVQVQFKGQWGNICYRTFSLNEQLASVICRQKGFYGGDNAVLNENITVNVSSFPTFLDGVECTGNEQSVGECKFWGLGYSRTYCTPEDALGVSCYTEDYVLPVKLVDGPGPYEGRLEVYLMERWGSVCHLPENITDAKENFGPIVCRQLGYQGGDLIPYYGGGTGRINLAGVNCNGNEKNIGHCKHAGVGYVLGFCNHFYDIGVKCDNVRINGTTASPNPNATTTTPVTTPPDLHIRLVGGNKNSGTFQYVYNGQWHTLCYHDLFADDFSIFANIACRQLGYDSGVLTNGSLFYTRLNGPIDATDAFICYNESATHLNQCNKLYVGFWSSSDCSNHQNDVGLYCLAKGEELNPTTRLVGGSDSSEGRFEIQFANTWGSACLGFWEYNPVYPQVVCKQLGFENGIRVNPSKVYGSTSDPVLIDQIDCTIGNFSSITQCKHSGYGITQDVCKNHEHDVGLKCYNGNFNLETRLLASNHITGASLVQVKFNNTWGNICYASFSRNNYFSKVLCRSKGYFGGVTAAINQQSLNHLDISLLDYPYWFEGIKCTGEETNIGQCPNYGIGYFRYRCSPDQSIGVFCYKEDYKMPVRLVGGKGPFEGRLEVFTLNRWGTVCINSNVNIKNPGYFAPIVCSQLGYTGGVAVESDVFGRGNGFINLAAVHCEKTDKNIAHCHHAGLGYRLTSCSHKFDVGVKCDVPPTTTPSTTFSTMRTTPVRPTIPTRPPKPTNPQERTGQGPNIVPIVVGVICGILLLVLIAVILVVLYRRYSFKNVHQRFQDDTSSVASSNIGRGNSAAGFNNPAYIAAGVVAYDNEMQETSLSPGDSYINTDLQKEQVPDPTLSEDPSLTVSNPTYDNLPLPGTTGQPMQGPPALSNPTYDNAPITGTTQGDTNARESLAEYSEVLFEGRNTASAT